MRREGRYRRDGGICNWMRDWRGFDMSYVCDYQCTTGGKRKKMEMELHSDLR